MLNDQQRQWLDRKTRRVDFLVRMVLVILAVGVAIGIAVDMAVPQWINVEAAEQEIEPVPSESNSQWHKIEADAAAGHWGKVWWAIPAQILNGWRNPGVTLLALLTGLCWLVFLLQAASANRSRLVASLAGVALGVVSIWFTLFFILWQEVRWNLVESEQLVPGLRFWILGVGLREELAKLLCFLPLLPLAVRCRDPLMAFAAAASVGIGFGMEENVGYIGSSAGSNTLGRLSVVPFHMATTSLAGLAAYRACRWPKEGIPQFLAIFGGVVLLHGAYDALISMPQFADYRIGVTIMFCLLMWQFFRELHELRPARREIISLSATFLACITVVAAATFVYLAAAAGWKVAFDVVFRAALAQAVIAYLFLREMPESLVTV